MLLPLRCPVCGGPGGAPCPACTSRLKGAGPVVPRPAGVVSCTAALDYRGTGRELVARLKYRNARAGVPFLATAMAALVDAATVDVVTWAPTIGARRRRRGYDQAEILARAMARRLGLPVRRLLVRRAGPAQTGLPLAARIHGPVFAVRPARRPWPGRVLLVDDVVTSGATVTAAARALRAAGATEVHAVAAARTPPPGSVDGPLDSTMAVCGSVVESRRQSQAKRPT